jgi:hypothetical protein
MMAKIIISPGGNGSISILYPATDKIPIEEIARKDVPAGVPFLIVEDTELPATREDRYAWTADFSNPDGVGIGAEAWFAEQENQP